MADRRLRYFQICYQNIQIPGYRTITVAYMDKTVKVQCQVYKFFIFIPPAFLPVTA